MNPTVWWLGELAATVRAAIWLAVVASLAGCGQPPGASAPGDSTDTGSPPATTVGAGQPAGPTAGVPSGTAESPAANQGTPGAPVTVVIASSDLAVGPERFAFAILDPTRSLVPDAEAKVTFFEIDGETATPKMTGAAAFYPSKLERAGLYVIYTEFERVGPWGAQIEAKLPDGSFIQPQRVRFEVAAEAASPMVGDPVPPTANRTTADPALLASITSDPHPDPRLYALTVDEAVASGKPTVIVFATPGFCTSELCGPVLDEVKALMNAWGDKAQFIHIEVYATFEPLVLSPLMDEWGLATEPWVFVLDAEGKVVARLEGNATATEIEPILQTLTSG